MPVNARMRTLNRRQFLIRSGWIAGGLTILSGCQSLLPALPTMADPEPSEALLWLQLQANGQVKFFCPRMEMGQGAALGLTQIIAEELNLPASQITCELPKTSLVAPFKMTTGSDSISVFHEPISTAAATLRETLRQRIALLEGCQTNQLSDAVGGFVHDSGRHIDYRRAVQDEQPILLEEVDFDPDTVRRYMKSGGSKLPAIGKDWSDPDLHSIVTGKMTYSRDMWVDNMAFGGVFRAPYYFAMLEKVTWNGAAGTKGVLAVFQSKTHNFAGIVAENPLALKDAMAKVDVQWKAAPESDERLTSSRWITRHEPLQSDDFEHVLHEEGHGDADFLETESTLTAYYSTSYAAHAAMEPRAAVVSVTDTETQVWCGTQDPYFVRDRVARALNRSQKEVTVQPLRMGGAFGGRVFCPEAEEAALLSAAVGRPVRVQWERADEFQNGYCQPPFSHRIRAQVDLQGNVEMWQHDFVSSPIITGPVGGNLAWIVDLFVADKGTARGAISPYGFANQRVRYSDLRTGISVGPWRGLGAAPNGFAIEGMMNELAAIANLDPFTFRLQNLPKAETRLAHALQTLRQLCNWDQAVPHPHVGRGIAAAIYKGETRVAVAAEVIHDPDQGSIRVRHIWCVQDCGSVINPDQVENQIAGNVIWGCSMALKEELSFEDGLAGADNFNAYEILRHGEAPKITLKLTDPTGAKPSPVGESALPPVPAAIAEAVFQATQKRCRHLPLPQSIG